MNFNKITLIETPLILLNQLALGITLREIAAKLNVSSNTIKTRVQTLYNKLGVTCRSDLIYKALKLGILTYADIKPKFRKRFIKIKTTKPEALLLTYLTGEEARFLYLISQGHKTKNIIKMMGLSGTYHARILKSSILWKLNSKNIVQAVVSAKLLEII